MVYWKTESRKFGTSSMFHRLFKLLLVKKIEAEPLAS